VELYGVDLGAAPLDGGLHRRSCCGVGLRVSERQRDRPNAAGEQHDTPDLVEGEGEVPHSAAGRERPRVLLQGRRVGEQAQRPVAESPMDHVWARGEAAHPHGAVAQLDRLVHHLLHPRPHRVECLYLLG
jgi:hypothetical protein